MVILPGDTVTIDYTARLEDGTVIDTTHEQVAVESGLADRQPDRTFEPVTAVMATPDLIEGLQEVLMGMEAGDQKTVDISPERAYGEWSEEEVRTFDHEEFDEMADGAAPEPGLVVETDEGELGRITDVTDEEVEIDFNHSLAGETLTFDVEVLEVEEGEGRMRTGGGGLE